MGNWTGREGAKGGRAGIERGERRGQGGGEEEERRDLAHLLEENKGQSKAARGVRARREEEKWDRTCAFECLRKEWRPVACERTTERLLGHRGGS